MVRLGSPEKASQLGMIEGVEHPNNDATKITLGVLGAATTTAVGLYLYKRRRTKTKNTEQEHPKPVPDPMDVV